MSDPIQQADAHLVAILKLADEGGIQWQEETPPRPKAMRAFSGFAGKYNILVCQANVEGRGIIHECMAVVTESTGPMVIHFGRETADKLYHQAAAKRN